MRLFALLHASEENPLAGDGDEHESWRDRNECSVRGSLENN